MKKELELTKCQTSVNKFDFKEDVFDSLITKIALPILAVSYIGSMSVAIYFANPLFLLAGVAGIILGPLMASIFDGKVMRKKICHIAKSRGIEFTKNEKRLLLKNLKTENFHGKLTIGSLDFEINTVWQGTIRHVSVHMPESNQSEEPNCTSNDNFRAESNEAFHHALTINNVSLVAHFSKSRALQVLPDSPFQKEISSRVDKLNNLVAENSLGKNVPYSVNMNNDTVNIGFSHRDMCNGASLKSHFKGIENAFEKHLMEGLKTKYAEK